MLKISRINDLDFVFIGLALGCFWQQKLNLSLLFSAHFGHMFMTDNSCHTFNLPVPFDFTRYTKCSIYYLLEFQRFCTLILGIACFRTYFIPFSFACGVVSAHSHLLVDWFLHILICLWTVVPAHSHLLVDWSLLIICLWTGPCSSFACGLVPVHHLLVDWSLFIICLWTGPCSTTFFTITGFVYVKECKFAKCTM